MTKITHKKTLSEIVHDFFTNPFRLFFLLASISIIPIACLWLSVGLSAYFGWPALMPSIDPLSYHAYGYINIFGSAAFAGFIMTAVPEWTHFTHPLRRLSALCLGVWLGAVVLAFISLQSSALLMSIFWLLLTGFTVVAAIDDRNDKQISVCLMMSLITALNIAYALTGKWTYIVMMTHAYMIGVALIIFRIGMAMGFNSLEQAGSKADKLSYVQNPYYRNLNVICMYLYIFSLMFFSDPVFSSWLALASGLSMLARLRDWHHAILWHASYVRWHYLTLLCFGLGYCWLGVSGILSWGNPTQALHLILIGGFIFMVMQIFNIAGLIHSGRDLPFPWISQWAFAVIFTAAMLRSMSLNFRWSHALLSLVIPSTLLIIAFALYIPVFWRVFISTEAVPPSPRI
ncbi:MAG: NnrS family protein [Alcaligenaceae bacterium]|nr:NnrS family protein [Alcaligenaceae bacterium]